ncbi:hypothetical protein SG34_006765 [Thalassomonas viridans]|uniref:Solute-binding protein family 3/N-terminal domain-containing protein n=1 Tax=Thalassomonas viridans TaxID=137584 RepID=A0AAE9Z5F1_9GAMM|nr:hypothetical protein [Thalassomonas viridans]WDE06607.1 hypothetical protein SG34_006765 [Thalassomonas viridans]
MKINRKLLVCFWASMVFCFFRGEAKTFIIGVEDVSYYPIYDFSSTRGHQPSFTKELLSTFFDTHKYSYRFIALPIKRFNQWYIDEGIDFKFPDNVRWQQETDKGLDITFSDPVLTLMSGVYMLKSRLPMQRDEVKSLGTILGFQPTLWLDKVNAKEVTLQEESSPLSIVKHLLHGNIDATNIDGNVIRHNLASLKRSGELVLNKAIHHETYAYHFSTIKYPGVIAQFNVFLKTHAALVRALKQKYQITEAITLSDSSSNQTEG